jgi:hypothetical protein
MSSEQSPSIPATLQSFRLTDPCGFFGNRFVLLHFSAGFWLLCALMRQLAEQFSYDFLSSSWNYLSLSFSGRHIEYLVLPSRCGLVCVV